MVIITDITKQNKMSCTRPYSDLSPNVLLDFTMALQAIRAQLFKASLA